MDPTKQRRWLWHSDFTGQHTATLTNGVSSDRTCRRRGLMFDTGSGGPTRSASFGTAAYPLHMHTHYPSIMTKLYRRRQEQTHPPWLSRSIPAHYVRQTLTWEQSGLFLGDWAPCKYRYWEHFTNTLSDTHRHRESATPDVHQLLSSL